MQKYQILDQAGSGHFSEVFRARDIETGEIVAVKDLNYNEEVQRLLMKELQILSGLDHPNIIRMLHVDRTTESIRVVFEYMQENLLELYTTSKLGINQNQLRCILYQCALGLRYLHSKHIIHRDIKPENIMINRQTALVKLIDFGLAKEDNEAQTDYVATRWYRSPENLIGLRKSTVAIDIFALGCVAVEMFNQLPLFPGVDTVDQISKLFSLLGTPSNTEWPDGFNQLKKKNVTFDHQDRKGVSCMVQRASKEFKDLLQRMLQLDPQKRITAEQMTYHPFFKHIDRLIPKKSGFITTAPTKQSTIKTTTESALRENGESRKNNHFNTQQPSADTDRRRRSPVANNQSMITKNLRENSPAGKGLPLYPNREQKAVSKMVTTPRGISLPNNNMVNRTTQVPLNHLSRKVYLSPQKAEPVVAAPVSRRSKQLKVVAPQQPSIIQSLPNTTPKTLTPVNQNTRIPSQGASINIFIPFRR